MKKIDIKYGKSLSINRHQELHRKIKVIKELKGINFLKVKSGGWQQPKRRGYLMKCCDCGLVHKINFRLIKDKIGRAKIQMQAFRVE